MKNSTNSKTAAEEKADEMKCLSVYTFTSLIDRLEERAKSERRSLSLMSAVLLEEALDARDAKDPLK